MASRIPTSSTAELEELTILINLLAVRAGGPLHVAAADDCDVKYDGEVLDLPTGTSRLDTLSQSRFELYDRFLNRISEIFSSERNGRFVTASGLREREQELQVEICLARNNGFTQPEDQEMVEAVQTSLNRLTGADRGVETEPEDLWTNMLKYSRPRLAFYRSNLKEILDENRDDLKDYVHRPSSISTDLFQGVWRRLYDHFYFHTSTATFQPLKDLVQIGAEVRDWTFAVCADFNALAIQYPFLSKVRYVLCLVGKISSALRTFRTISATVWQGYTIKIIPLENVPKPQQFAKTGMNLEGALQRLGISNVSAATTALLSKPKSRQKFLEVQKQKTYVHAEIQLIFHLMSTGITDAYPYIGTSKLPCVLCAEFMKADRTFASQNSHEHLYPKWMIPEIEQIPRDMEDHVSATLAAFDQTLRQHLLSPPQPGKNFRPESTVDTTLVAQDLAGAENPARQSSLQLAIRQRERVQEQERLTRLLYPAEDEDCESENIPDPSNDDLHQVSVSHQDSDDDSGVYECDGCDRSTTRRCSRCDRDYFCSLSCESRMSTTHRFLCAYGRLTTADYLYQDLGCDQIPDDPDVLEHFGFEGLPTPVDRSKLLGLYIGLRNLEITGSELHKWRVSGVLVERIVQTFMERPEDSRGGYFPWFLENKDAIFPTNPATDPERDLICRIYDPVKCLLELSDRQLPVEELQPGAKKSCFTFASMLAHITPPPPEFSGLSEFTGPYFDFGFCVSRDESERQALCVLYFHLVFGHERHPQDIYWNGIKEMPGDIDRFRQFWQAFHQGTLVQLMDNAGLRQQRILLRHLHTYLNDQETVRDFCVWKLQGWLNAYSEAAIPPKEVFVDFGFIHCSSPLATSELRRLYAQLLKKSDLIRLHQAHVAGRLFEFATQHVQVDSKMAEILRRCWTAS